MTRGKRPHPPKKKHGNRPRPPPVVPLTADQRATKAQQEFDKAIVHLLEAEQMARWGRAPNACAHSAYYAMHHCAAAAILAAGGVGRYGDVPKSHNHVVEHYGVLTKDEPGYLGSSGIALSQAQAEREIADYDLGQGVTRSDAEAITREARRFVAACAGKWGFRSSAGIDLSDLDSGGPTSS